MHLEAKAIPSASAMATDFLPCGLDLPGAFDPRTSASSPFGPFGNNHSITGLMVTMPEPPAIAGSPQYTPQLARSRILDGEEYIATHNGSSQYSKGGSSACGLACLNCVRIVLNAEANGMAGDALLEYMVDTSLIEEALSLCSSFTAREHLELEDIYKVPLFQATLEFADAEYGKPNRAKFQHMLLHLVGMGRTHSGNRSAAVVITRPPEMVACFKIAHPSRDVFVLFDSHPRPDHPNGAALIFNTSLMKVARYLSKLMHYEENAINDAELQWQAQLLGNVSGDFFVSKLEANSLETAERLLMTASIELLTSKAAMIALKSRQTDLETENKQLAKVVTEYQEKVERMKAAQRRGTSVPPMPPISDGWYSAVASTSRAFTKAPFEYFKPTSQQKPAKSPSPSYAHAAASTQSHQKGKQPVTVVRLVSKDSDEAGYAYALQLQRQFEEEDARLRDERNDLLHRTQSVFQCGVCMDELPEDDLAIVDSCSHPFCRDCARQYAVTKIADHRFPILCPTCTASRQAENPGVISEDLLMLLGITEEQYQTFVEMQLASFCILMHCRECERGVFVDRGEYDATKVITCPLPSCEYKWCKQCQQACEAGGPEHTCDGTAELDHLMNRNGWKYCPSCKTPTEKIMGCNHMTCGAPACNTHFCYVCGQLIVQSALRKDIQDAVAAHYRACRIFDDVPDTH